MILNSVTPDIAWIVPWSVLQQLSHLWRRFGLLSDLKTRLYLSNQQLQTLGIPLEWDIFHLLIEPDFVAVLWGKVAPTTHNAKPAAMTNHEQCEMFMCFDPQAIAPLVEMLRHSMDDLPQLALLERNFLPKCSRLPPAMILAMLEIMRSPQIHDVPNSHGDIPNQPLNVLLNQRLEQERILNNVTHRIYQNQDLMVTVRMALEQAQRLLRVDRLLVYQLDLPTEDPAILIDSVTFEVLSSPKIPSLLHYQKDECLKTNQLIKEAYLDGRFLAVNDVTEDDYLADCFKEQLSAMQVKAKMVVPLIVEQQLWGLLIAHQCNAPRRWRKNEITFLTHVAEYLAIAILQARSYQQLQEQKTSLETLAKQRAQELEDALLSAQVASQSKKEFIHIMSHELLTPLTAIIGLSNTLSYWLSADSSHPLSPDKQRAYLNTIHDSGLRLRNLLQDILDFSQIEAARSALDLKEFSLKKLCHMVLASFQEMGRRQGLTLKFVNRLDPEQELFYADPNRLEKILNHLLSNAIKFTSHGGKVTLTIWREEQEDVLIQVKDTGIGIPPQQMPLLFEKFQQLEPSISRTYDGAGFGLALVKQLVELHQGNIQVTSTPNKGSTFTVRIPQQTEASLHPHNQRALGGNQGGTIVLVSQDEETATLICDLLTATNYQVIWLIDSAIAMEQIITLRPILVILDDHQSKIRVEEIAASLQHSPQTQRIPKLLIGDRLNAEQEQAWKQRGIQAYLPKPIPSETLIDTVNYHVTRYYATLR